MRGGWHGILCSVAVFVPSMTLNCKTAVLLVQLPVPILTAAVHKSCCSGACTQLGHLWSPTFVTVAGTANDTLQGKPLENVLREKPSSRITDGWGLWRPPTLSTSGKGAQDLALLRTVAVGGAQAGHPLGSSALHTRPIGSRDDGQRPDLGDRALCFPRQEAPSLHPCEQRNAGQLPVFWLQC